MTFCQFSRIPKHGSLMNTGLLNECTSYPYAFNKFCLRVQSENIVRFGDFNTFKIKIP